MIFNFDDLEEERRPDVPETHPTKKTKKPAANGGDGPHHTKSPPAPEPEPLGEPISPTYLVDMAVPQREWIVCDWIPVGHSCGVYGPGGTGKSLLVQQLQTALAGGVPWCGMHLRKGRSLAVYCEDSSDELHRRQVAICESMGTTLGALSDMFYFSRIGRDNALASFSFDGRLVIAPLFYQIKDLALSLRARVVCFDTVSRIFAGNENDRRQVGEFIGLLDRLAVEIHGAVLFTAHPSRGGEALGDHSSGSTQWNNALRSRLTLASPENGDDKSLRVLQRRKSNYAEAGQEIRLRWQDGAFVPLFEPGGALAACAHARIDAVFLSLLDRLTAAGRRVSPKRTANNYAGTVMGEQPDREGFTRKDFGAAIERLVYTGQIAFRTYGAPSKDFQEIIRMPASMPASLPA